MSITYADEPSFYEGIYNMVSKGLTFQAVHHDLTIHLLGGY